MAPENESSARNEAVIERLGLRGRKLAELPWVAVSRGGRAARSEEVVHSVSSSEELVEAFGRRARDMPNAS